MENVKPMNAKSKDTANKLSKALWEIGIENFVGINMRKYDRWRWMCQYVVRIKINSFGGAYAEFRHNWETYDTAFDLAVIYEVGKTKIDPNKLFSIKDELNNIINKANKVSGNTLFDRSLCFRYKKRSLGCRSSFLC